jgi:hypothetical protein
MTRSFLRMLSGAAGLLAAFTAMSLPLLLPHSGAESDLPGLSFHSLMAETPALSSVRVLLAVAACSLLRFALSQGGTARLLRFHSRPQ